jgi:hypothetical protein
MEGLYVYNMHNIEKPHPCEAGTIASNRYFTPLFPNVY